MVFLYENKISKLLVVNPLKSSGTYVYHDCDCNVTKALLRRHYNSNL